MGMIRVVRVNHRVLVVGVGHPSRLDGDGASLLMPFTAGSSLKAEQVKRRPRFVLVHWFDSSLTRIGVNKMSKHYNRQLIIRVIRQI